MSPNPLARHRRLGTRIRQLREERGYTHASLASAAGVSTAVVSRLENPLGNMGRRPSARYVRKLLDALDVPEPEYKELERHAAVATAGGWWDAPEYAQMGLGQRDAAVVEYGAAIVDEYGGTLLPGLTQTRDAAWCRSTDRPYPDAVADGRMERQRQIVGATYRLIIEEQAVRRWPVPDDVMRGQLDYLLDLVTRDDVSIRVLPTDARLGEGIAPRAPYAHVSYPDPEDDPVVIVDFVAEVRLVTEPLPVRGYAQLHERLRNAAMSDADSAALIRSVADSLASRT